MSGKQDNSVKGNILVVDDTPANLRLLISMLSKRGYQVRPAPSGQLALKAAFSTSPDLILLDIMMPDMDGYEVCKALKADVRTRETPIIFISALNEVFNKVTAFSVGGVDYVTKPFQTEEVLVRVDTHLSLFKTRQALAEKNRELEKALTKIKTLRGLLPICANCKKIRNDEGYWTQLEVYIRQHSEADFSHSICPDCMETLYPGFFNDEIEGKQQF